MSTAWYAPISAGESRHYWLVEINEGKVQQIYDSLQGVQPLTQEIYRMLQVTGILLKSTSSNKPVLKCPQLEQKAGIIEAVSRRAPTIKVASRSRTCKTRHELVKSMNRLSITPTKAYGVSKKLGKKMKGANIELKQVDTHERLLLPRNSTAKKPQASGPARKRAKKKTHPKRTQKAGTPVQWWVLTLHENVAKDAHIQLQVDFPRCKGTSGRCTLDDTQVGVQRILPLNYSTMHLPPIVGVCQEKVEAGDRLAVLPLNSPVVAAVREMEGLVVPMQGNVKTTIVMCQCGSLHALLHSSADLCPGDILVPSNACEPRIMVQFDGSAHRTRGVGGAGAALLQVECSGLALLDWEAQALPVCADNIVAETHGADLALSLYEKYRQLSQQHLAKGGRVHSFGGLLTRWWFLPLMVPRPPCSSVEMNG